MGALPFTKTPSKSRPSPFCRATSTNTNRFIALDKQIVEFASFAINRPDMKGEQDIFNRVMPRDNIATVTFLEHRFTGSRLIVVNAHLTWNPIFKDVKVVQCAILMEEVTKLAKKYAKWPPCTEKELFRYANGDDANQEPGEALKPAPSMEYPDGPSIPMIVCGDYNSTHDSGVYELMVRGSLPSTHPDLSERTYGDFTRNGIHHPFQLKSSYQDELPFTNYTPGFRG